MVFLLKFFFLCIVLSGNLNAAVFSSSLEQKSENKRIDERQLDTVNMSFSGEVGYYGKDIRAGVSIAFELESKFINVGFFVPLYVPFTQPKETFSSFRSSACRYISCYEWLDLHGTFQYYHLLRIAENMTLATKDKTLRLQLGSFKIDRSYGLQFDSFTNSLIWDKRRQGVNLEWELFSGAFSISYLNADILSPHLVNALTLELSPFRFFTMTSNKDIDDFLKRVELSMTFIQSTSIKSEKDLELHFWQYTEKVSLSKSDFIAETDLALPLFHDSSKWQFIPVLSASTMYGGKTVLSDNKFGHGFAFSTQLRQRSSWISFLLEVRADYSSSFHRFSMFSSYALESDDYNIKRLLVPHFGGRFKFDVLFLDHFRFGSRIVTEEGLNNTLLESYFRMHFIDTHIGASVLSPYFKIEENRRLLMTLLKRSILKFDVSYNIWGPFSLYTRFEQVLLPKHEKRQVFIDSKADAQIFEQRFFFGLSTNVAVHSNL